MQRVEDCWQKLSNKAKKVIIAIMMDTAAIATVGVSVSKSGLGRDYSALLTGPNQEETQQVIALLPEQGADYRFNDREGAVRVPPANVNQIRAEFLSTGYPKSGFSYGTYRNNTGLMTAESGEKQYTLYELQDRFGTQARLSDGVQDAKIIITEVGEPVYVYGDDTEIEASASVVVTVMSRRSLSDNGAAVIKSLIATSVREMDFVNVAVLNTDTMMEVGGRSDDGDYGSARGVAVFAGLAENSIAANVCGVFEKPYEQGKTAISVEDTLSMEKLIQENIWYTTPEKVDEQDKTGLLYKEDTTNENFGAAVPGNGGVMGVDANVGMPRYTNQSDVQISTDLYANSGTAREWLYDSAKEQRQAGPGVLENTIIGTVIDTDDTSIFIQDLINLVTGSAGISKEEAWQKVAITRVLPSSGQAVVQSVATVSAQAQARSFPLPIIIAAIAGGILIPLLFVLLLTGRKRKKRDSLDGMELMVESASEEESPSAPATEIELDIQYRDEEMEKNEQILNPRTQHSLKLKQNIGEFADQDPQTAAKLVQS